MTSHAEYGLAKAVKTLLRLRAISDFEPTKVMSTLLGYCSSLNPEERRDCARIEQLEQAVANFESGKISLSGLMAEAFGLCEGEQHVLNPELRPLEETLKACEL